MPKNNPFFHYLKEHHRAYVEIKTNKVGENYLLFHLNAPSMPIDFEYEETQLDFIEHHLTVFENQSDRIGFNSSSHYTLHFESHTIHVYFDSNGSFINATIENNELQVTDVLDNYLDERHAFLRVLLEKDVNPILMNLYEAHHQKIDELENSYMTSLNLFQAKLFQTSEDIDSNLRKINDLIKKGTKIELIGFKNNFVHRTLAFLHKCRENFQESAESLKKAKEKSKKSIVSAAKAPITPASEETSISIPSNTKLTVKQKKKSEQSSNQDILDFNNAYQAFLEQFQLLESQTSLSDKINMFTIVNDHFFLDLKGKALIVYGLIHSNDIEQALLLSKADLDITLFQEKMNALGVSLLVECLATEVLLSEFGTRLTPFISYLNPTHLKKLIQQQNILGLTFVLGNEEFNLNNLRIKTKKGMLTPLCFAFRSYQIAQNQEARAKSLELFQILLQHKASALAFYEDMPLAHHLLELKTDDPLYSVFMRICEPAKNSNPQFYTFLSKSVDFKLENSELLEHEIVSLQLAKTKYERNKSGHIHGFKLSNGCMDNIMAISNQMNPEMLSKLKYSPEINALADEITIKAQEFHQIIAKKHLKAQFSSMCNRVYTNAKKLIDQGLGAIYGNFTEADILTSLRSNIEQLDAARYVFENHTKSFRTKEEERMLQSALAILNKQVQNQQTIEKQVSTYEETEKELRKITSYLENLDESIKPLIPQITKSFFESENLNYDSIIDRFILNIINDGPISSPSSRLGNQGFFPSPAATIPNEAGPDVLESYSPK